jgi:hypothetical protein
LGPRIWVHDNKNKTKEKLYAFLAGELQEGESVNTYPLLSPPIHAAKLFYDGMQFQRWVSRQKKIRAYNFLFI